MENEGDQVSEKVSMLLPGDGDWELLNSVGSAAAEEVEAPLSQEDWLFLIVPDSNWLFLYDELLDEPRLRVALARALALFPTLTGRLHVRGSKTTIRCNNAGIQYTVQEVVDKTRRLIRHNKEDFTAAQQCGEEFRTLTGPSKRALAKGPDGFVQRDRPLLSVTVTLEPHGGTRGAGACAINILIPHVIADGAAYFHFLHAWTSIYREDEDTKLLSLRPSSITHDYHDLVQAMDNESEAKNAPNCAPDGAAASLSGQRSITALTVAVGLISLLYVKLRLRFGDDWLLVAACSAASAALVLLLWTQPVGQRWCWESSVSPSGSMRTYAGPTYMLLQGLLYLAGAHQAARLLGWKQLALACGSALVAFGTVVKRVMPGVAPAVIHVTSEAIEYLQRTQGMAAAEKWSPHAKSIEFLSRNDLVIAAMWKAVAMVQRERVWGVLFQRMEMELSMTMDLRTRVGRENDIGPFIGNASCMLIVNMPGPRLCEASVHEIACEIRHTINKMNKELIAQDMRWLRRVIGRGLHPHVGWLFFRPFHTTAISNMSTIPVFEMADFTSLPPRSSFAEPPLNLKPFWWNPGYFNPPYGGFAFHAYEFRGVVGPAPEPADQQTRKAQYPFGLWGRSFSSKRGQSISYPPRSPRTPLSPGSPGSPRAAEGKVIFLTVPEHKVQRFKQLWEELVADGLERASDESVMAVGQGSERSNGKARSSEEGDERSTVVSGLQGFRTLEDDDSEDDSERSSS